jgi:raffinose/stachyose/melibiose transport system substrate-binding protein
MKKNPILLVIVMILAVGVSWAGGNAETEETGIVMKISDNIPDRTVTWGAVIEQINAEFIQQHPEVKIETESYPDQPYQEKIKIYATAGQLPDVMKYWSFSTLLQPLVESELVTPLDKADFSDFGWLPGALESNIYNGKLYGIPVSGDLWVIYYNQAILTECGVEPPETMADLYDAGAKISAKGYTPIVTDGKDGWPLSITFDNIFWRINGDYSLIHAALDGRKPFTDPEFVRAAEEYQKFFLNSGLFGKDLTTSDYGAARNLFGQGRAAMYLMGSWELGLASDTNFPQSFRGNVRAMKFPVLASGKGKVNDLVAWFGGNYIVNAKTEHMDLAMEYLKLYAKMYPKLIWEQQAGFPAQKISPSADDTAVAKDLLTIAGDAVATSGTTALDLLTPAFKDSHQKLCKDLAAGIITPLQFCRGLQKAVDEVNK